MTSSDTIAVLPHAAGVKFAGGLASFQVTVNSTGSQSLTLSDADNPGLTSTATTRVGISRFVGRSRPAGP